MSFRDSQISLRLECKELERRGRLQNPFPGPSHRAASLPGDWPVRKREDVTLLVPEIEFHRVSALTVAKFQGKAAKRPGGAVLIGRPLP